MELIDLRSDTVTKPTPAMREAMYRAEVGDDVYGEDPTVRRLEALAAELLGKEAGLLVSSGSQGNLIAQLVHCARGDEVICGQTSHIFMSETASAAVVGGLQLRTLPTREGRFDLEAVEAAVRPYNDHYPTTGLITIENTHNGDGGAPLDAEYTRAVAAIARRAGARFHVDGARIFNAAVALGVPARTLVEPADSVTFCLSKGLAAPVGSVLCGSAEFVRAGRKQRKLLGGGMRQAGIIAAAGIVALTEMIDRLAEDHANARLLAEGLATIPGLRLNPPQPRTNMVFVEFDPGGISGADFAARMREQGVLVSGNPKRLRMVTHYGITREQIERAVEAARRAAQAPAVAAGAGTAAGAPTYG